MEYPSLSIVVKYSGIVAILVFFYFYYKKKAQREREQAVERRSSYLREHADISDELREAISEGEIIEGMTEEELLASIGLPLRRRVLTAEPAKIEELVFARVYVHLHMGIVQDWKYQEKLSGLH